MTLDPGNSLELFFGTVSGDVTVDSSAYLFLNYDFTLKNLTLNGGNVDVGEIGGTLTIPTDGLMQGYGDIVGSPALIAGVITLQNDGTIISDIAGQSLDIRQTFFFNNGLVEATNGGNISIDLSNFGIDTIYNNADGVIGISDGSTLQLGQRNTIKMLAF